MSDLPRGGFTLQLRSTGTRLAAAVTAVLAVTAVGAGTLATAPAAFAATSAAAGQASGLPVFPKGDNLAGVGTSGFFSYDYADGVMSLIWTPYDGGPSTRLHRPEGGGFALAGNDLAVIGDESWTVQMRSLTLRNMADPAAPGVDIDLGALNGNYVAVLSPTSVLAQITKADGTAELHVVTRNGATTTTRKVAGLPADATEFTGSTARDGSVLVGYATGPANARTGGRALVDTAAGTVTETYASVDSGYDYTQLMFSASHVAWLDYSDEDGLYVTSVDRKTREEKKTALGSRTEPWFCELVGDRLVYGARWSTARAVSLSSGESQDLGVTTAASASSSDGSAVLQGSRGDEGDGLFRVATAQDGTLAVTKVAETGVRVVPLAIQEVHVPDTVNPDTTSGRVNLSWTLSRADAYLDVTLTHIATGKEFKARVDAPAKGTTFSLSWDGVIEESTPDETGFVDAPNGKYAVEAEATLLDGTGEPAYQGWMTNLARTYNPHDFNDNGSTDVLFRDAAGVLWREDLRDRTPLYGEVRTAKTTRIGSGWGIYKTIEAVGNAGGAATGDVIAVDGSGVQWLYLGKGDGTFAPRVKVGTGWQVYNKVAGGSDLDGDNRPDAVAADTSGVLWFYKGTGNYAKPYAPRVRVGGGWQVFNQITAVGNIAGTAAGDLVARDTSGVLWLYQGNGRGGFAPGVKVGGGWGAYSQFVGADDLDNDGRPDLIAYGTSGEYGAYVYRSTGTVTGPFRARQTTDLFRYDGLRYGNVS
ncbi:VCBS repeat-containing protein [Streptomyces sp. NPDC001728]|uniref:FG-GAP repeat domain-containing protein n=1 Tax=Streptomyces sp. NPDC001728 TaxID=3154396 RepID=UPI00332F63D5